MTGQLLSSIPLTDLALCLLGSINTGTFALPEEYNINGSRIILVRDAAGWGAKCLDWRLMESGQWKKNGLWRWPNATEALKAIEKAVEDDRLSRE